MTCELGYERYAVQGGDWGGPIASELGARSPEHVIGVHLNFIAAPAPADPGPEDAAAIDRLTRWRRYEAAYYQLQSTRPDSLTVARSDSPAGLAGWIVEKFRRWSDCEGGIERAFTKDTLLTNLMFYWAPNSASTAARLYYENARERDVTANRPRVDVPVAYAAFPHEIFQPPRRWAEPHYAIARWTEMPRGGHFAASRSQSCYSTTSARSSARCGSAPASMQLGGPSLRHVRTRRCRADGKHRLRNPAGPAGIG
jgi:pimeloyl-ACP methyl ester carboxylesterase